MSGRPVVGLAPKGTGTTGRTVVGLAPKTGGTTGRAVVGLAPSTPAKKSGGHGLLHALASAGHFVADKTERAARDIKGIPIGTYDIVNRGAVQPWKDVLTTGHVSKKTNANIDKLINQASDSTEQTLAHPGRDPFATLTLLAPGLHGASRLGEKVAGVDVAAPRVLRSGGKETPLIRSRSATGRVAQHVYDKTVQKALDKNEVGKATGRVSSRVAAHGQKRIGGALSEQGRIAQKMRAAPASLLDRSAVKLSKVPGKRRVEQAALELTSAQTSPAEAARYHMAQAEKGVNAARNKSVAKLYQRVDERGLVHVDESKPAGAKVFINPAHERLAKVDAALSRVQSAGDKVLVDKNVRDPGALASRRNAPAQIRAGATFEKPTPGKAGVSPALIKATAERDRIAALHEKALEREQTFLQDQPKKVAAVGARTGGPSLPLDNPYRERINNLGSALEVANQRVDAITRQAKKRSKPTGIVGGTSARPGRGFVSYKASEKKLGRSEASNSPGPVIGAAKSPLTAKTFTGRSIEHGFIPKEVTGSASRHFRQILRFVNTDEARKAALETGSATRRSPRDILVRVPDQTAKPLSAEIQQALGREASTVDKPADLALATEEGLQAAHQAFLDRIIPGRTDGFAAEAGHGIGTQAPDGYRWVDQGALGDLLKPPRGPRGRVARTADSINSAITSATVYFKIGHVGTRVFTNAATNIIQGSAGPRQIGRSARLWNAISEEQRVRALAAAGQHGFAALPHEGTNLSARIATKGAQWWAKHADAPFRFNSLAYELRRVGYDTPTKFGHALDALETGGQGLASGEWAKVSTAARRADREAISYDRLNDFEKRFITRAVWFYPWIKGSTMFTVRTLLEHPYKAGALGQAGVHGRQVQQRTLGDTPTYEAGLLALTGGQSPLTTDFSTFSPFATAADVVQAPVMPGALAGFLNPAAGVAGQLVYGLNQYGGTSNQPYMDALKALGASTPEQQIAEAYAGRNSDQSGKMFPKSPGGSALRFLLGPATPRRVNRSALAKAAARERSGRR